MFTKFQLPKILDTLLTKKPKTPNYIYRDALINKYKHGLPKRLLRSPKILVDHHFDDESLEVFSELKEPLLLPSQTSCKDNIISTNNDSISTSNVRVRVLMTKKEAAMLLSKCKEEGTLEFKDVVSELAKLPTQRIDVVSVATSCLATIPEEDEEDFVTNC